MQDLLSQIGFTLSSVAVTVATLCKHPPTQFLTVAASPWVFCKPSSSTTASDVTSPVEESSEPTVPQSGAN